MTDQVLTEERHSELAALLNDEHRLNTEYPKVADYLDTALRLPGTGDARVDGSFDLRLVHYMVGGTSSPLWIAPQPRATGNRSPDEGSATSRNGPAALIPFSVVRSTHCGRNP